MDKRKGFTINVSTKFEGRDRYGVDMMCGCFDSEGIRTGFASSTDNADAGCKQGYTMETPECDRIELHIYVVPRILPEAALTRLTPPFTVEVTICDADGEVLRREFDADQWSGASIDLQVGHAR